MAKRILNRRELRKQTDHAEHIEAGATDTDLAEATPKIKVKKSRASAVKKPRAKKAPPRMRARWGVFDGGMKQVAIFDYNRRADADAKLADLRATKKGLFFLQITKEVMAEPAAEEGAAAEGRIG